MLGDNLFKIISLHYDVGIQCEYGIDYEKTKETINQRNS